MSCDPNVRYFVRTKIPGKLQIDRFTDDSIAKYLKHLSQIYNEIFKKFVTKKCIKKYSEIL